ncbi:Proline--tRNA ligase [Fusarium keratoplasticum]|uniref:Proline--tRNA ligase n=1 Tax=Fusarium keratoplasticum TaxID=1328300 RepID=A0ACC0QKP9_9HYPO|nr:Proline--tRNA ligase [Fusarium keratoplasticum]KAI8655062.1 Proline--tRNA ligase [Fusarium keratoplasticum]
MAPQSSTAVDRKSDELIGITVSKIENFPQWYQEVVIKAEMVEYYGEVAGLFVLRPMTMFIWSEMRKWFQKHLDEMGIGEASFPLFLSSKSLAKEQDHIEGFAPELAWVTKAGDKNLDVPVAIRPTSEAIMYPYYSKWIRSHRDLPLRLNQWNSVVRWETKQTTPFLRTREFLWQEGHTAHLTEEEAGKEVLEILELYAKIYEDLLAVPVVRGRKTENERFAGGYYTMTLEGYIPSNGRGIQGATSHCLGQNFSKMFDIAVQDPAGEGHVHVWQNSWAFSTRVIGVMVMIHGDDKGLVLPPRVAKIQVVIVPVGISKKTTAEEKDQLLDQADEIRATLKKDAHLRVDVDAREGYTPAWKFNDWELKGVPLRLEFGPKDAMKGVVSYTQRYNNEKGTIPITEITTTVPKMLEEIQKGMYSRADATFKEHRRVVTAWDDVMGALDNKDLVLIPFCLDGKCEDQIKELTTKVEEEQGAPSMGMKSLCIPFEQPSALEEGTKCLNPECERLAKQWTMYVQKLLDKIKSQEEQLKERAGSRSTVDPSSELSPGNGDVVSDAGSEQNQLDELPLSPATELASGPAFESRVRSILRDHVDNNSLNLQTSPESSAFVSSAIEEEPHDHWRNALTLVDGIPSPTLLSKQESRRLFERFSSLMGINQHFLDPRTFSDSMDLLYQNETSRIRQMQTMWYTEYLLVMAMGMLIGSPSEGSANPPGNSFFAEAIHRLPPMHKLGSHGILSVEILCLASLYLQWCDRKYDAYLYIGSAVRLAIALGCSLPHDEQQGLSSEITHRVRVWWTAYMLDRRLSAGLGLPTGTDDRQLRSEMPRPAAGFQNPLPMIINIKIAQVTGKITTSFYGNAALTRTELVKKIQETLQTLHDIGRSIPSALSIDFTDSSSTIARTSASLYLMLFLAIILCIRPILLQRVKEKVQASKDNSPRAPVSPAISRLCQTCQEAAIKTIRILSALREDKSIALFGYFDLDATFSAAFVLTMMGFVEGDLQEPPEGLKQAAEILKYLSNAGNSAAQRRLNDLKQFCLHVWSPTNMTDDWSWLKEGSVSSLDNSPANRQNFSGDGGGNPNLQADAMTTWGPAAWISWQSTATGGEDAVHLDFSASENFQMDLSHEAGDIYSSFNDPTLPLTGVDDVDWAEVGKMFHMRNI